MKKSKVASTLGPVDNAPLSARGSSGGKSNQAINPMSQSLPALPFKEKTFLKPILGDLFSQHLDTKKALEGLLYRSRIEAKQTGKQQSSNTTRDPLLDSDDTATVASVNSSENSVDELVDIDDSNIKDLSLKQQLAITIRNWSCNEENDESIISEGAVHALISLASNEDPFIKTCCATALYNLSSRVRNREKLLSLGTTTGVITLAMQIKSWKIAQYCAMTLCNLSMQANYEGVMAKDGTILALVILMGLKGQKLLPICVQALYNLTCIDSYFKGCERIVKAVLNLPPSGSNFDHQMYIVKIFVNCSRYSWMRLRIIEDGAIATMIAVIHSLQNRDPDNVKELVDNILASIRLLSETPACRQEMLSKGIADIFSPLYLYCDNKNKHVMIKTIQNLVSGTTLTPPIYDSFASLVARICMEAPPDDLVLNQYCAACLQIFTKDYMRGNLKVAGKVIECLPVLLDINDACCRFYSISTAGNVFFSNLCQDQSKIEILLRAFITAGEKLDDVDTVREFSLSLAKLAVEPNYMALLERLSLLEVILQILLQLVKVHASDAIMEEYCVIAICSVSLKLQSMKDDVRIELAGVLVSLLNRDSILLLENVIGCIYALGEVGLCLKEMLSKTLVLNIAQIVNKYASHVNICRTCCAALVVFSQTAESHSILAEDKVLDMLLSTTKSTDASTREFVAMALCNISNDIEARDKLIKKGVVELIGNLAGSTSESLLLICSKCICNLTLSIDMHSTLCKQNILQIIMMISLVRCVKHETKLLCARSTYNLISLKNLSAFKTSGAVRVVAALSIINDKDIQMICAKSFLLLSSSVEMREEVIQHTTVLQALFGMVKINSRRTSAVIGAAVCNLLACKVSQMATILAGGLSVLKVFVTMRKDQLKEAIAKVLISLAGIPELHKYLLREPIVQILLLSLQRGPSKGSILNCSLSALSRLSQYKQARYALISNGCVTGLVNSIIQGHIFEPFSLLETLRCLTFLSFETEYSKGMVTNGHIVLALHAIHCQKQLLTPMIARMISIILRNISFEPYVSHLMIQQDAFGLLFSIIREHSEVKSFTLKCALIVVHNLSLDEELHTSLIESNVISILREMILQCDCDLMSDSNKYYGMSTAKLGAFISQPGHKLIMTEDDAYYICRSLNNISKTQECHEGIAKGGIVEVLHLLYPALTEISKFEISSALGRVAGSKSCRMALNQAGAASILLDLSLSTYLPTQQQCNLALSYLSDITKVSKGNIASTLMLCLSIDEKTEPELESASNVATVKPDEALKDKSLKAMVNEGLSGMKAELSIKEMPGAGKSIEFEKSIPDSISDNKLYKEIVKIEMDQLTGSYNDYQYDMIIEEVTLEAGGSANEIHIKLPLPSIHGDRDARVATDRSNDLTKIPITKDPLAKDTTDWSHILTAEPPPVVEEVVASPSKIVKVDSFKSEDDSLSSSMKVKYGGLAKYKNKLPGQAWSKLKKSIIEGQISSDRDWTSPSSKSVRSEMSGLYDDDVSYSGLSVSSDITANS